MSQSIDQQVKAGATLLGSAQGDALFAVEDLFCGMSSIQEYEPQWYRLAKQAQTGGLPRCMLQQAKAGNKPPAMSLLMQASSKLFIIVSDSS